MKELLSARANNRLKLTAHWANFLSARSLAWALAHTIMFAEVAEFLCHEDTILQELFADVFFAPCVTGTGGFGTGYKTPWAALSKQLFGGSIWKLNGQLARIEPYTP